MKKKLIYISLIVLVITLIQVIANNRDFVKNMGSISTEIEVNDLIPKDLVYDNNKWIAAGNDSWFEYSNTIHDVRNIKLSISYENKGSVLQVFYTTEENEGYSEQKSVTINTSENKSNYLIQMDKPTDIRKLRIDATNEPGAVVELNNVTINAKDKLDIINKEILWNTLKFSIIIILLSAVFTYIDIIVRHRYKIAAILFVILVVFKIHGSSIGMWNQYIPDSANNTIETTLLGKERPIRSDEWLVQTPYMLAQAHEFKMFSYYNKNIRSDGQNMVLANAPTLTIELIGKPFYWGYFLFGKDYGLSWFWCLKMILLLLFSFEISMLLTRGNKVIAMVGALWIGFSPPIQWWYTTGAGVVELVIYSQAIIVMAIYYFKTDSVKRKVILLILATISSIGFIFTLYPAVQVPLGILTLIIVAAILFENRSKIRMTRQEIYAGLSCIVFIMCALVIFYINCRNDIDLMLNTEYPGNREINGGKYLWSDLQLYLISWLLPYKDSQFSNNSTLSSAFNILPLILLSLAYLFNGRLGNRKLIYPILIYVLFQISWLFVEYPAIISKITLFSFVPENRLAGITLAISAMYLSIWFVNEVIDKKIYNLKQSIIVCFVLFIFYSYSIHSSPMNDYLGHYSLIAIVGFVLLNLIILLGMRRLFVIAILGLIIVSGMTVNPISKGTASIFEKEVANKIYSINKDNEDTNWAAVDSVVNGQYLVALGIPTLNSVHFYPDYKLWREIDPTGAYQNVYNRYAHVVISLTEDETKFVLDQADKFTVYMNIDQFRNTGVDYILSSSDLSKFKQLEMIYYGDTDHLYIYKWNYNLLD